MVKIKINRKYDLPYVGGMNVAGDIVYIDRRLPKIIPGTPIKVERYLFIHETVEQNLEDQLNMQYHNAHHLATVVEHSALVQDGLSEYRKDYDDFYKKWVKICRESFTHIPPDIDATPYVESKDTQLLDRMKLIEPKLLWKGKK